MNQLGRARAQALVAALEGTAIDAIFAPDIQRNLDTAAPLAQARGIEVQTLPALDPAPDLMARGAGQTIVWVGNKDNLQSIWDRLALPGPPPLEYGDLFIVEKAPIGPARVLRRRVEV